MSSLKVVKMIEVQVDQPLRCKGMILFGDAGVSSGQWPAVKVDATGWGIARIVAVAVGSRSIPLNHPWSLVKGTRRYGHGCEYDCGCAALADVGVDVDAGVGVRLLNIAVGFDPSDLKSGDSMLFAPM